MAVTNDNLLLLCYSGDKSKALSIWSETGDHIQDCALAGSAWGLAGIPGTNDAVVTLPYEESIQFVNITNMVPGNVIKVPGKSYGVAVAKNMIVLGGAGKVYFFSMTGTLKKTLNVGSKILYSLRVNKMDRIYCCESENQALHCIDIKGTSIFSYKFSTSEGPVDISFDSMENLYVTTWKSNKFHRLTPDGKLIDILMTKDDGLVEPFASVFNKNFSTLYIVNSVLLSEKTVLIFNSVNHT